MVDGAALEKRSPCLAERGFESHPLRQKVTRKGIGCNLGLTHHGEVLEWTIRRAWRARVAFGYRGFESHPLRHLLTSIRRHATFVVSPAPPPHRVPLEVPLPQHPRGNELEPIPFTSLPHVPFHSPPLFDGL